MRKARLRSRFLLALGVALGVALAGGVVLELAYRLWLYGPAGLSPERLASVRPIGASDLIEPDGDPRVGYRLKAGYEGWFQLRRFTTNSAGRRDRERPPPGPGAPRPIVALGDSYTMGSGVADGEAWPARLEEHLRGDGLDLDVLNFGVGGYSLLHELGALEVALARDPRLVVVGLSWNDVEPPPAGYFARFFGATSAWPEPAPALPFLRLTILERLSGRRGSQPPPAEALALDYLRALELEDPVGDDYVSLAITALVRRCQEDAVPLLFAFLSTGPGEPGVEVVERFEAAASAAGAGFVDTREGTASIPRGRLIVRPDNGHPNARAHALYGELIAAAISRGTKVTAEPTPSDRARTGW